MKLNNFRLIDEVRKRRPLWDSTMQFSFRKDIGAKQWQEVACKMQLDVATCKKRFKGLRDSYRSEIRKIQEKRLETSNWPYFRAMEFLRDIFDPYKLVSFPPLCCDIDSNNPEFVSNDLEDFIIDADNEDSFDFEIMGDIFKRDPSDTVGHEAGSDMSKMKRKHLDSSIVLNISAPINKSDVEFSPKPVSPMLPKAPVAKRTKRRNIPSSTDGNNQNGHQSTKVKPPQAESTNNDDPDYNFLISLLPHVKSLSSLNNMKFRTEVSRMLMEMNQEDMQTRRDKLISTPSTNCGHNLEGDKSKYSSNNSFNGNVILAHSSVTECDVKIENESMY